MRRKRLIRVITYALCIFTAGLVYGTFAKYTGLAIPCPIYTITGLKCPGCGVTRMCMALMQLDFDRAFSCHPVLFLLLIPLGIVCMGYAVTYVKDGSIKLKLWQNVILYISIVLLTGYGLVRNIM